MLSTMYSFMKDAGFTYLNLEGIMEWRIVYNHWRKSTKISYGWRTFAQSQNLEVHYFRFVYNLSTLYYTNICKFLFITLGDIFCGKWCLEHIENICGKFLFISGMFCVSFLLITLYGIFCYNFGLFLEFKKSSKTNFNF